MKSRLLKSRFTLTLAALFVGALAGHAADVTWTGLNSANWNDVGNWNPGLPSAGDSLIFDTSAQTSPFNNITDGVFGGINFTPTSAQYILGGNSIVLDGALVVNSNTVLQTLSLPIVLSNAVTFNTVSNVDTTVGDLEITTTVSGPGALVKTGGGTLNLTGTNSFSGGTTINQGLLVAATDNGNYTMSGGSLLIKYGSWYSPRNINFTADAAVGIEAGATLYNAYGRYDLYGNIGAPGFLWTKFGNGRIQLAGGSNHLLSSVYVKEGVLSDVNGGNTTLSGLGTNLITVESGAALRKNNGGIVLNPIVLNGGAGPDNLGALVANQEAFAGQPTTIVATFSNTITLNSDSTLGAIYGSMAIPGNITGAGGLTKVGDYPLILGGNNNYGGNTIISAGTLKLESSFAIPGGVTNGNLNLDGSSGLDLNGFNATINGLATDGSGTPTIDNTSTNPSALTLGGNDATASWTGPLSSSGGPLSIIKIGAGSASFLGANTHTGSNVVSGGTLELNIPTGTTTGGLVALANGTTLTLHKTTASSSLKASGATFGTSSSTTLNIDLGNWGNASLPVINATNGTGVLAVNGAVTVTFSGLGNIALGQFPIIKYTTRTGTGSFVLTPLGGGLVAQIVTNAVNKSIDLQVTTAPITTWKGNVNNLWDTTTANWTFSGSPTLYADGNAVFFPDGALTNVVDLTAALYPSSTLHNSTNDYVFTGFGSLAAGDLTKNGSGRLTLVTENSYNNTFISAGTLQVGTNGMTGSLGYGTVSVDGTLEFNRADDIYIANAIGGSGVVVQSNTNVLTLASANTYSGGTLVNQGAVKLDSATALGAPSTGKILATIANGASLDINGQYVTTTNATRISGAGLNNGGAIYNSGSGTYVGGSSRGLNNVVLTGDAVINATGDWIIGQSGLGLSGNGYNLTKTGYGAVYLRTSASSAFNQFIVGEGGILIESANPFGTGTSLVLSNNAWLDSWGNNNGGPNNYTIANNIMIGAGGGQILNTRGHWWSTPDYDTYTGAITLNHTLIVRNSSVYNGLLGRLTLSGPISGVGGITKTGPYLVTLSGANTYAGSTTVSNGTLALSAISQGGGSYTNVDEATLDVPSQTGYSTVPMSTLALGSLNGSTLALTRVSALSTSLAPITATNLVLTGTNAIIAPVAAYATAGQYPLIKYTTLTGTIDNLALGAAGARGLPGYLSNNVANSSIDLVVPGGAPVLWTGISGSLWDIDTTANWQTNGVATTYLQGDAVTFNDSSTVTNVELSAPVSPAMVIVNTTNTYAFSGTNITGNAALLKGGSGVLILSNRNNNFVGGTLVSAGTLKMAYTPTAQLNNLSGTVTVASGATLDMGSNNPSAMVINASGAGVNGSGAIQANYSGGGAAMGPSIINLQGNTTIGGNNRMDLRNGSKQLNASTPNTSLTKVGSGYFGLVAATVSTNLGDITILGGRISYQTSTAGLGHTNGTIYIGGSGGLGFYQATVPLVKNIVCSNGASLFAESGNTLGQNVIAGPVNLATGTTTIKGNYYNGLYISNTISGPGSLALEFQSYVYLAASNTFTGTLTVPNCNASNGGRGTRLSLIGNGSVMNASQIYLQGIAPGQAHAGWLALEGRPDATLTLGANQLFRGDNGSYVRGSVVAPATSAIAPGGINNSNYQYMIIGTNLTLQAGSTNYMDIYKTASLLTNDLIMVSNVVTYAGTLVIRANGPVAITNGDSFKLFQAGSSVGNYASIVDPSGATWSFNPTTGVATVLTAPPTVNLTPTNIVSSVSGSALTMEWPADHIGWFLQSNSISLVNTSTWFNVPGSEITNKIIITIDPASTNVFYRMKY